MRVRQPLRKAGGVIAGIGWKLERLLERRSLSGALWAYLTGVAVTSGPWLLTTLTLVILRVMAIRAGQPGIQIVEQVITVVYAMVLVLTAPVDVVVARFTSDLVYQGKPERILAPLLRTLAAVVVSLFGAGAAAMALLGTPIDLAIAGTILSVVVGGQWIFLGAAGGLSSPGTVLKAFALGAPVSVVASMVLSETGLGAAGNLWGFCAGQVLTLALLLTGTLRALPPEEDTSARILPAFGRYRLLALAALFFHAGIWLDKIVAYFLAGGDSA